MSWWGRHDGRVAGAGARPLDSLERMSIGGRAAVPDWAAAGCGVCIRGYLSADRSWLGSGWDAGMLDRPAGSVSLDGMTAGEAVSAAMAGAVPLVVVRLVVEEGAGSGVRVAAVWPLLGPDGGLVGWSEPVGMWSNRGGTADLWGWTAQTARGRDGRIGHWAGRLPGLAAAELPSGRAVPVGLLADPSVNPSLLEGLVRASSVVPSRAPAPWDPVAVARVGLAAAGSGVTHLRAVGASASGWESRSAAARTLCGVEAGPGGVSADWGPCGRCMEVAEYDGVRLDGFDGSLPLELEVAAARSALGV